MVRGEVAGFGRDLSIDLSYCFVAAVFEEGVLVIEFGEPCCQGQLMPLALVDSEGELPGFQRAGQHASCERSRGGLLASLAGGWMEGEAEFVKCRGEQVVDVVVRLGAGAGGEDSKAGDVESRDERITGGVDDIARTVFPHTPESGMVL
ncbi:hypothetical protein AMK31_38010 [Streptomyces sp. TSRI0107]|nr:hypothetical protein AMK31_38010 [Streptomyces sp. TSRI0107]